MARFRFSLPALFGFVTIVHLRTDFPTIDNEHWRKHLGFLRT
ncbi:MAG TPA: hypothetical protein VGX78_14430 [Pirellulales bacterium]|jgi:hypothetical protein|nr:hypothetical protein [Pirellulales bacterium]